MASTGQGKKRQVYARVQARVAEDVIPIIGITQLRSLPKQLNVQAEWKKSISSFVGSARDIWIIQSHLEKICEEEDATPIDDAPEDEDEISDLDDEVNEGSTPTAAPNSKDYTDTGLDGNTTTQEQQFAQQNGTGAEKHTVGTNYACQQYPDPRVANADLQQHDTRPKHPSVNRRNSQSDVQKQDGPQKMILTRQNSGPPKFNNDHNSHEEGILHQTGSPPEDQASNANAMDQYGRRETPMETDESSSIQTQHGATDSQSQQEETTTFSLGNTEEKTYHQGDILGQSHPNQPTSDNSQSRQTSNTDMQRPESTQPHSQNGQEIQNQSNVAGSIDRKNIMQGGTSPYVAIIDMSQEEWEYIREHYPHKIKMDNVKYENSIAANGNIRIQGADREAVRPVWIEINKLITGIREKISFGKIDIQAFITKQTEVTKIADAYQNKETYKKISMWIFFKDATIIFAAPKDVYEALNDEIMSKLSALSTGRHGQPKRERQRKMLDTNQHEKTFRAANGTHIHCVVGDLTTLIVDAVVSSNNGNLSNKVGVSRAIAKSAGRGFEEECRKTVTKNKGGLKPLQVAITGACNLPCRKVVHIVSPVRTPGHTGQDKLKEDLRDAYLKILHKADSSDAKLKSIAIPAIGAGQSGVAAGEVAELMCQAVLSFCRSPSSLKHILLIDMNAELPKLTSSILSVSATSNNLEELSRSTFQQFFPGREKPSTCAGGVESQGTSAPVMGAESQARLNTTKQVDPAGAKSKNKAPDTPNTGILILEKPKDGYDKECSICMDNIKPEEYSRLPCKHVFCRGCIQTWLKDKLSCPECGEVFGVMTGNQPPGKMEVTELNCKLSGHEKDSSGTFMIAYTFPQGRQGREHPNPGKFYKGRAVTAYLPKNKEGCEVLELFKRAFHAKVLFTIGRSLTTGKDDRITWNDIHQKTKMQGQYGYPDGGYLIRVRQELAAKGIKTE